MRKLLFPIGFVILAAAAAINVGCGANSAASPPFLTPPPATAAPTPSGTIIVTPASTAAAPFQMCIGPGKSQTFVASELHYNGSFTFDTSHVGQYLGATASDSVTIHSFTSTFVCASPHLTIVVSDALGNAATIYLD